MCSLDFDVIDNDLKEHEYYTTRYLINNREEYLEAYINIYKLKEKYGKEFVNSIETHKKNKCISILIEVLRPLYS